MKFSGEIKDIELVKKRLEEFYISSSIKRVDGGEDQLIVHDIFCEVNEDGEDRFVMGRKESKDEGTKSVVPVREYKSELVDGIYTVKGYKEPDLVNSKERRRFKNSPVINLDREEFIKAWRSSMERMFYEMGGEPDYHTNKWAYKDDILIKIEGYIGELIPAKFYEVETQSPVQSSRRDYDLTIGDKNIEVKATTSSRPYLTAYNRDSYADIYLLVYLLSLNRGVILGYATGEEISNKPVSEANRGDTELHKMYWSDTNKIREDVE